MKKQNIIILAGGALVFLWLLSQEKAKAQTSNKVYASHQYAPVWQGLPSENISERTYTYA